MILHHRPVTLHATLLRRRITVALKLIEFLIKRVDLVLQLLDTSLIRISCA